ncbi:hypothetical protein, partial [Aeromonas veronii]|uniref:hypothetical protein n=1 Tax=Aeromonas veronii TaxID=654 RepID=UPI003D1DDFDF
EGYHQSAVGHLSPFIHECRTYYLNSRRHMSVIEEIKGLNANSAVILSIFFVSFIAPAFLLIYRLNPELFLALGKVRTSGSHLHHELFVRI